MTRKTVSSQNAPKAVGPYSHAVWTGNLLYCSGTIPRLSPRPGKLLTVESVNKRSRFSKTLKPYWQVLD